MFVGIKVYKRLINELTEYYYLPVYTHVDTTNFAWTTADQFVIVLQIRIKIQTSTLFKQ